jgi:hypothetical protein
MPVWKLLGRPACLQMLSAICREGGALLHYEPRAVDRALPEMVTAARVPDELAAIVAQQRERIAPVVR